MEKKLANIERQKKEENLRQLAQKARNTRIGLKETAPTEGRSLKCTVHIHSYVCTCIHVTILVDYRIRCFQQSVPKGESKCPYNVENRYQLGCFPQHTCTSRNMVSHSGPINLKLSTSFPLIEGKSPNLC